MTRSSSSCTRLFLKAGTTQPDLALWHYTALKHRQPACSTAPGQPFTRGMPHFQSGASVLFLINCTGASKPLCTFSSPVVEVEPHGYELLFSVCYLNSNLSPAAPGELKPLDPSNTPVIFMQCSNQLWCLYWSLPNTSTRAGAKTHSVSAEAHSSAVSVPTVGLQTSSICVTLITSPYAPRKWL